MALLNLNLAFNDRDARSFDAGVHLEDGPDDGHSKLFRGRIEMSAFLLGGSYNDISAIQVDSDAISRALEREFRTRVHFNA